ncbi:FAD-dependent monooxygenase [Pontivivens ytuae]|uniref:FAD-dependent monooxygenase n=1 Tax=Pontivivens ytuae TaxID=2789856 RepID=A0A7S9LTM9_9RHOB|nr:FAD-dependent monooxygenase [Pontivivens ytuae]QPH55097.1 FAD-dependent monooxygenase [Pontivivens ytuae]
MQVDPPFRAAIVGGSVGGLAAALELRLRLGADVAVYERSAGAMQVRGAGVVMQPEIEALLNRIGVGTRAICVELHERVFLKQDGTPQRQQAPQLMTAWDTLYKTMRAHLADACYRQDSRLMSIDQSGDGISIAFADGYDTEADLLIGADGINSTCRALLTDAGSDAQYAGYVAWRGLEEESALPRQLVAALADRFTFYNSPGLQMLCYLVPGADGATRPGARRVNWVCYVNTPEEALVHLMMGRSGTQFRSFLPPGEASEDAMRTVAELAERCLPPLLRDLVAASTLFMQPVQDVDVQPRVHGRAVLLGDAAGTARPHTASGTSKAFGDAALLAEALRDWRGGTPPPTERLEQWDASRNADLTVLARHGRRLAAHSGLGIAAA